MKQLTCEMCGSTDLVKQDGLFICQNCTTKYSVEEAKKMMTEGTAEIYGTVKIDSSNMVVNYLEIAQNAYDGGNGQSSFEYANKALEIAPKNVDAWIIKMKSIEYIGTIGNLRLPEMTTAGQNAINFSGEEEKEITEVVVYQYYLTRALELLKVAMIHMQDTTNVESTFKSFALISPFTAAKNCLSADSALVNLYDGVANEAIALTKTVPETAFKKSNNFCKLLRECARQYQYVTDSLVKRYKIYGATLLDSAMSIRVAGKNEMEECATEGEEQYAILKEKELQERIEQYWLEHIDEKIVLDAEKQSLSEQIATLVTEISKVPGDTEKAQVQERIKRLTDKKSKLGVFKGKEKKGLQEQIDAANAEINAISAQMDVVIGAITAKISPLKERLFQINNELAKER